MPPVEDIQNITIAVYQLELDDLDSWASNWAHDLKGFAEFFIAVQNLVYPPIVEDNSTILQGSKVVVTKIKLEQPVGNKNQLFLAQHDAINALMMTFLDSRFRKDPVSIDLLNSLTNQQKQRLLKKLSDRLAQSDKAVADRNKMTKLIYWILSNTNSAIIYDSTSFELIELATFNPSIMSIPGVSDALEQFAT